MKKENRNVMSKTSDVMSSGGACYAGNGYGTYFMQQLKAAGYKDRIVSPGRNNEKFDVWKRKN